MTLTPFMFFMIVVGFDTSTDALAIGIVKNGKALAAHNKIEPRRHCAFLISRIQGLLKTARLKFSDIDGFAVGIGPGSFTGLRIGVTTAKGFAYATKKPLIGVPTLDAVARSYLDEIASLPEFTLSNSEGVAHNDKEGLSDRGNIEWEFSVAVDAKRNNVYTATYRVKGSHLRRISAYAILPRQEVEDFKHPLVDMPPLGEWVAQIGWEMLKRGRRDDPFKLVPMYLYPKECDIITGLRGKG